MSNLEKTEIEIIRHAYDSWFTSMLENETNEVIAHRAKRLKYLVDWVCLTLEIENERNTK
tara:strand:- start:1362 stop:1541 length:180 start_codon:yes stop_codon:yes gene_type:complete